MSPGRPGAPSPVRGRRRALPLLAGPDLTRVWARRLRRMYLAAAVPGIVGSLMGVLAQADAPGDLRRPDLLLLLALALTLTVCGALVALRRLEAVRALQVTYAVSAGYFLLVVGQKLTMTVGAQQQLSAATFWFPVLFITAFVAWDVRPALRISAVMYALTLLLTGLSLLGQPTPDRAPLAVSALQFLLAQGVTIALLTSLAHMKEHLTEVRTLAYMDVLTGLPNRRYVEEHWTHVRRGVRTVVLFDVDHFKQVNDRHGHATGDEVLRDLAQLVRRITPRTTLLARWGGEEFLLLIPGQSAAEAQRSVEVLRAAIAAHRFTVGHVTASFGVADGTDRHALSDCVHRADQAMYRAKEAGRNRVELTPEPPPARVSGEAHP